MLLRASQHKKMVWKNGGGITNEVARAPPNDQEEFDWRISLAQVTPPGGPFSLFLNVDRTLCIVNQNELRLTIHDVNQDSFCLNQNSVPYSFPGELSITCEIQAGQLTDLNVMTRRNKFRHDVERIKMQLGQEKSINPPNHEGEIVFVIVGQGKAITSDQIEMNRYDALRIDHNLSAVKLSSAADDTQIYFIRLERIY